MPAKKLGIRAAMPVTMALRLYPQLVIVRGDWEWYKRCSEGFIAICRSYSPVLQQFSIDECFMDMTGTGHMYPDPVALAHTIKDRIRDELGFTVNIGIGRNKLCAKMASDFEKPDKVHTLYPEEIPDKLWPLPVGDLLFVGGASANRLREEHIYTIGELAHADPELLRRILGDKMSLQARNYANGIDNSPVRAEPEEAKGYSNSVTLEENVTTLEAADAILLALSDSVSAHMRSDGAKAYCVAVSIRYLDFKNRSHQCKTDHPVESTREIYELSKRLLRELWKEHRPLRLMSIALSNLTREDEGGQMSLFGDEDSGRRERDVKLDKAVDALRSKFGADIIQRGTVMKDGLQVARKFKGKQASEQEKT
jgi:DNA polymerase-4